MLQIIEKAMISCNLIAARSRILCYRSFATKLTEHQTAMMARGLPKQAPLPGVRDIVVVASGKGGVGKTTVAVNLAVSMARMGKRVGLLDGDIFGPSIPLMMNLHSEPFVNDKNMMVPPQNYNIKCISMGMLTPPDGAIIWRGPMVMSAIQRLLKGTDWGPLDMLVVDTPPGTGEVHLSLTQHVPIAGVVLVSTPHAAAMEVTLRGAQMYNKFKVPIFGLVENMRYSICSNCNQRMELFKDPEGKSFKGLPDTLVSLPLEPIIAECCESGVPVVIKYPDSEYAKCFTNLAMTISNMLTQRKQTAEAAKDDVRKLS
ncbi:iron-sulfur protein NUBPL [Scaptodrosophila lebanonensis]|uniref:Iron-sulfur protein NUBPL n=1 Tax=Drosophila lebanonensis TaxID=7225 RepID=A0A6J2TNC4_DROLE|nr:iron-sulfur protein NUBPL [Scaptodrosophila lebanonensis]